MAEKSDAVAFETTSDAWLGGRLALRQPLKGHRIGSDAALLAAAAPAGEHIVDVGAGVGAVGLALLRRLPQAQVDLVEIDADLAVLAEENAAANGLAARTRVVVADVANARSRRAGGLVDGAADVVVTNPPFFDRARVRISPDARRAQAHVLARGEGEGLALAAWIAGALALLKPGGRFLMIHRPDALAEIFQCFERRLGAIEILPIHPRAEVPAHRLLLAGIKGARTPISLRPALVLHDATGAFTKQAKALHRGEAVIDWGAGGVSA
ncbi:MAG TPA: methyltransferase [Roseiarcus sp.]|nr:methyltransferase [Roseiarcus sp.]